MSMPLLQPSCDTEKGFSLVEIMVGMVIGMLGILVILNIFAMSEGQKRTTTSGSDAQTNGGIALHLLERDIRMAGYGFSTLVSPTLGNLCPNGIRAYNQDIPPPGDTYTAGIVPLEINPAGIPAGDANTATISIVYGASSRLVDGVEFKQTAAGAGANFEVASTRAGFNLGDMVIVTPSTPGLQCTMIEVSGLPESNQCGTSGNTGGATGKKTIVHTNGQYENFYRNCQQVPASHNKAGGLGVDYWSAGNIHGKLFNIGPGPTMKSYAVRNGRLTVCDGAANNCADAGAVGNAAVWVPIANDIVSLRAVYGKDTTGDQIVDSWDTAAPANPNQVLAARIAVVARSGLQEKVNQTTGQCDITTVQPTWTGTAEGAPINLSAIPNWQCYRYRTYQTTVPLRSMIWKSS